MGDMPCARRALSKFPEFPMAAFSRRAALLMSVGGLVACATEVPTTPPDPTGRADPEMKALLESLASLKPLPLETLTAAQARRQPGMTDAVKARLRTLGRPVTPRPLPFTRDFEIPGPGGPLAARVYSPAPNPRPANAPLLPLIVYFHGGGWVIADLETYDSSCRALAADCGAVVLSVHYRQGPEVKFPGAHDDAYAAYVWGVQNAAVMGADPSRVAVVGESAGGNLAINVAMAAREARAPLPVAVGLIYPVAGTDNTTPSYRANVNAKPLNPAVLKWMLDNYTRSPADLQDPRLAVYGRAELRGLPKAIIVTAEIDPLHDDGIRLAERLREAGVTVVARDYPGVTHEFFGADPATLSKAGDAQRFVAGELRAAFLRPEPATVPASAPGRRRG